MIRRPVSIVSGLLLLGLVVAPVAVGTNTDGQGVDLVCDGQWRHGRHTVTASDLSYPPGIAFLAGSLLFGDAAELHCADLSKKRTLVIMAT